MLEESRKQPLLENSHLNRQKGRQGNGSYRAYASQPNLQSNLAGESSWGGGGSHGDSVLVDGMGRLPLWPTELTGRHWYLQSA